MNRTLKRSMALLLCGTSAVWADSVADAFAQGSVGGEARLAYISQKNPAGTPDTTAGAIGGQLRYETASWNGVKLGVAAYISQKIDALSADGVKQNPDFFDAQGDSFAYVGEAYAEYAVNDLAVRVGRQQLDTPFADTDDIRMLPNTFEAAIATYTGLEKTTLIGGYVTRWAGFDSGDDISKFKRLDGASSKGAAVAGIIYEGVEALPLRGWYYGIDDLADAAYADAMYGHALNETLKLEFGAQAAYFDERRNSGIDGSVAGAFAMAEVGPLRCIGAFNVARSDGNKAVTNGFGGGPYFTSMEEMTIDGLNDAEAYVAVLEADFASLGAEGLNAVAAYGHFESGSVPSEEAEEVDLVVAYEFDNASAELSYAKIEDKHENIDGDWSRWLLRLNYTF